MTKKITLLFLTHLFLFYLSQTKPPESYSLIRGVNENINLNSGTVDLNIPLFDISVGKFKLNNTLKYESRGFSPNIPTGYVGLNWNMQQFGKITREFKRINPTMSSSSYLNPINNGFPEGDYSDPKDYFRNDCIKLVFPSIGGNKSYKKNIYENPYEKDYYSSIQFPDDPTGVYRGNSHNFDPDKYYFDFLGYKGYFLIDNEGNTIVYCENSSLKIDINDYGCHDIFGNIIFSQLKITDDKGNQYFFGGTKDALDINYYYSRVYIEDIEGSSSTAYDIYATEAKTNAIDSWLLKKIILNSGETIEAFYQNPNLDLLNNYRGGYNSTDNIIRTNFGAPQYQKYEDITGFPDRQTLINNNLTVTNSRILTKSASNGNCTPACGIFKLEQVDTYTKKAVLDSIKINNVTVSYKYDFTQVASDLSNKHLSEINIKQHNKIIKKINLLYRNFGLTNKRTFLKNVTNTNGENIYFEYYNTDDFPQLLLADYDINSLGYWKGNVDPSSYGGVDNFSAYDTGLLKKVIYPIKGSTTYFYEHGDYSRIFKYGESFNPYNYPPALYNENRTVNAPRLYKKIESDLNNNEETTYEYKNDDGSSSGIIEDAVYDNFGFYSNKNTVANLNSINSLHYSNVKIQKQLKGYTKYSFTDRISNPDISTSKVFYRPNYSYFCTSYHEWKESNKLYLSKQSERGKILREEIYNSNNLKIKETNYKYNNFLNKFPTLSLIENCSDCKVSDLNYYIRTGEYNMNCQKQTMYVPVIPYLLTSQTTKEYFNNKVIETTSDISYQNKIVKNYTQGLTGNDGYMWHPYPVEDKITINSKTSIKKYLYAIDLYKENPCAGFIGCNFANDNTIVGGQYADYQYLHYKNIFTPAIEITKNNENKYSIKENLFSQQNEPSNQFVVLKKVRHSKLDGNVDFVNYNIPTTNTLDDINYDVYDNRANNLQYTIKDGVPVTTIYGYNQTLPIANITGITYGELMQIFGLSVTSTGYLSLDIVSKSDEDKDDASEQLLFNALESFRNNPALANYQIITYTHNPLIGVTSITPPSGIREVYKYDTGNRLETVGDVNNNITKEYKYNFAPTIFYSSEKSKGFTRNNCGLATESITPVIYTVPANKYSSLIDKEDADQKAQNDLDTNGQNNANILGICQPYVCKMTPTHLANINYSSFQEASFNHIKGTLSFSFGSSGGSSPNWSDGVFIGTLDSRCRPSSQKSISVSSGSWYVSIGVGGDISVRSTSSVGSSGGTTLYFEYDKN